VRFARGCAGDRAVEWHVLTQAVIVTGDRRAAAEDLAKRYHHVLTREEILDTPFLLIGTIDEIAAQVLRNRDRYGFTYYTVHEPYLATFAPVIERVRGARSMTFRPAAGLSLVSTAERGLSG
jgi:hypothetical protein